jgi:uncharacterized protein (DUF2164 family)
MSIELDKSTKVQAQLSLQKYCKQELELALGNLPAEHLLQFILEEIGPAIYNQAVRDVQERIMARVQEVDIEVHEAEFTFWNKQFKHDRQGK